MFAHWMFLRLCYDGGREWFEKNIFRYIKEGDREYQDRVDRAYRFNHTREVVDLVDKHIFKMTPSRSEDAGDSVKRFWKRATRDGLGIEEFMRQVSKMCSIYGRIWIVTDTNKTGEVETKRDESESDVQTYAYFVTPEFVRDMGYGDDGVLRWILIQEVFRDDENPLTSSGQMRSRFRLWTQTDYTIITVVPKKNVKIKGGGVPARDDQFDVTIEGPYTHEFGEVPVFPADHAISNELYSSPALINDVAYLDRATTNYLSNLDAIIQDQTFSQLVIPAQGLTPGEDAHDKLLEMGTKRVFTYDGEGGKPEYISPDVKQANLLLAVINKIIAEIYHSVGLAGERTKDDNSQGIDNSSGVAKAYDFERVNSLLAAKADSLELVENRLARFVAKWNGEDVDEDKKLVVYPENFDVRGLYDEFEIAARLALIEAPDLVRRQQMEMVIDKLFPQLAKDLRDKMTTELKAWPVDPVEQMMQIAGNSQGAPASGGNGAKGNSAIKEAGNNSLANSLVKGKGSSK